MTQFPLLPAGYRTEVCGMHLFWAGKIMITHALHEPAATTSDDVFRFYVESNFSREFLSSKQKPDAHVGVARDIRVLPQRVLQEILGMMVPESTVYFLTLVPIAHAAWSQDCPNSLQVGRILEKVVELGIREGSPAQQLLRSWLLERPEPRLFDVWRDYVSALRRGMSPHGFERMHGAILHASRTVAACSEGFGLTLPNDYAFRQINEAFQG